MLQFQAEVENIAPDPIQPTLYVVVVSQGIFSLYNGQASSLVGVLTSDDILECHKQTGHHMLTYSDVQRMYGGNFLSKLANNLRKIWRKVGPVVKKGIKLAADYGPQALQVAEILGLGEQDMGGVRARGVRAGGAKMSRKKLKDRMRM
jgi:hypothetical protein